MGLFSLISLIGKTHQIKSTVKRCSIFDMVYRTRKEIENQSTAICPKFESETINLSENLSIHRISH